MISWCSARVGGWWNLLLHLLQYVQYKLIDIRLAIHDVDSLNHAILKLSLSKWLYWSQQRLQNEIEMIEIVLVSTPHTVYMNYSGLELCFARDNSRLWVHLSLKSSKNYSIDDLANCLQKYNIVKPWYLSNAMHWNILCILCGVYKTYRFLTRFNVLHAASWTCHCNYMHFSSTNRILCKIRMLIKSFHQCLPLYVLPSINNIYYGC